MIKSLQIDIIKRFMSTEEFMNFMDKYSEVRKPKGKALSLRKATPLDLKIAHEFKNGASLQDLSKTYGVSTYKILCSIAWSNK